MRQSFTTILIPVDFSINTEVAIAKALELIDPNEASIHLLHVIKPSMALIGSVTKHQIYREREMAKWKERITATIPSMMVYCHLEKAVSIQNCIKDLAESIHADLIVIGKNRSDRWLPFLHTVSPVKLAQQIRITLLTVKPGSLNNKCKTLIVPITDSLSLNKMAVIEALSQKTKLTIHLVTFIQGNAVPEDFSASPLLKVYQWLKNTSHNPVEYRVLNGSNKARAILQYAKKVNADIVLVYPDSETKIGWMNRHMSDVLPFSSKVQVMTVNPAGPMA